MESYSYGRFAGIYDKLIKPDIDYGQIAGFVAEYVGDNARDGGLILDLGCGTGSLTKELSERGYDMIGIDMSDEMLNIAKQKDEKSLYLCQDMREFELYGTVDAIICATDCINYITEPHDLLSVFKLAKNYLNPGAPFIFDINSPYKLKTVLGNNTYTYDDGEIFYTWENEYDEIEDICDFFLTFFCKKEGLYERFDEYHSQKKYEPDEIVSFLKQAGFNSVEVFDGYDKKTPTSETQRLVFIAN